VVPAFIAPMRRNVGSLVLLALFDPARASACAIVALPR
jgi:hypothetical protein